mmetsp:Transcript_26597/g.58893  ORF Transcript_26597/g.58893 Transcript_26597/m.58893 type:complete len:234 (+) Transcript_26597:520-1221(+)
MFCITSCIFCRVSAFASTDRFSISLSMSITSPDFSCTAGVGGGMLLSHSAPPSLGAFFTVVNSPSGDPFWDSKTSPSRGFLGVALANLEKPALWEGVSKTLVLDRLLPLNFAACTGLPITPFVTAVKLYPNSSLKRLMLICFTCVGSLISSKWNACWMDVDRKSESFWICAHLASSVWPRSSIKLETISGLYWISIWSICMSSSSDMREAFLDALLFLGGMLLCSVRSVELNL